MKKTLFILLTCLMSINLQADNNYYFACGGDNNSLKFAKQCGGSWDYGKTCGRHNLSTNANNLGQGTSKHDAGTLDQWNSVLPGLGYWGISSSQLIDCGGI